VIRLYRDRQPKLGARAWVDVSAQVIGDVELGDDASVWMNTVIRGDVNAIRVGARSNVQDNCVLHVTRQHPTTLAEEVTVAHSVTLHGCTVERLCLVGIGAIVLNGARIGRNCLIGAGALVTEGREIPDNSLVLGAPGKVARTLDEGAIAGMHRNTAGYFQRGQFYKGAMKRIG